MANDNFSLINFDGLSELAKALIDKISNAIGWIVSRETPGKTAVQTYIEDIKKGDFDPLTKAILISKAKQTIAEYANQRSIIQNAIYNMKENAHPEQIDNDWLSQFMEKAKLVSDSEFQLIWGRILSEECDMPGSVPRSLLHVLEQMDRNDAERFTKLCCCSVFVLEDGKRCYSPVIIGEQFESYYQELGLDLDTLIDLQALGLIEFNIGPFATGYTVKYSSAPVVIHYFDKEFSLPGEVRELPVGNVIFTKTGQALCQAIYGEEQESFWDHYCLPFWKKRI